MHPRILIVHHHVRQGGVTRVMRHALAALAEQPVSCAVLTGSAPVEPWPVPVGVVPELAYAEAGPPPSPDTLMAAMLAEARRLFQGNLPDLWHLHNHHLGKNPALTAVGARLAAAGHALLLHIHDFPEDGRPANYRHLCDCLRAWDEPMASLYPTSPRCHYALLNRRDREILRLAGAASAQLHWLPNAVADLPSKDAADPHERPLFLYPTRAIRRKNLGEMLLWAALHPEADFASTLVPENPAEQPVHQAWCRFSREHGLAVRFGIGNAADASFPALVASATAVLTTSVAEGFGLAFLEPWLMGRPLVGRDLPEITADFREVGVALDHLYDALPIPLDWLAGGELRTRMEQAWHRTLAAYGRESGPGAMAEAWAQWADAGRIDFGRLDETAQRQVIGKILSDPARAHDLPFNRALLTTTAMAAVEPNRGIVEASYGLGHHGERLLQTYHAVLGTPLAGDDPIDPERVLDGFLRPERFTMLRAVAPEDDASPPAPGGGGGP
jgi:hypothetical protein